MLHDKRFHKFSAHEMERVELPSKFTFPFHYVPHPLSVLASEHLRKYLATRLDWQDELRQGKMMGVLIVEKDTEIGFLAAFSGNLAHSNDHEYFVPAVYDLLSHDGFFPPEESQISEINAKIKCEESSSNRQSLISQISEATNRSKAEIDAYRELMQQSKIERDNRRREGADEDSLIAESQFQKAELRRIRNRWQQCFDSLKVEIAESDKKIAEWKAERKQRSQALQKRIFQNFVMLNAHGESRDLCEIFAPTPQVLPPAGAGECAAPKLLQYAYLHRYKPLAMAEFWVGASPKEEIRHDGYFYPACKAKCEPILNWMLQGLDVEPNPLEVSPQSIEIEVLYDDDFMVAVNKPHGMLSVPGKLSAISLQERMQQLYPQCDIQVVHRLDMATSGVLLFAKSQAIHRQLQAMFESRQIKKQYVAMLDGIVEQDCGIIDLPLILNPDDRPRQVVNYAHGKPALTRFEVVERCDTTTRVLFYPETGRTHQLRVHASHPDGLNTPIVGDTLYGSHASRLYLHAQSIEFIHPVTKKTITITTPCPF